MSPEDALFSHHNLDRIADEALNHQEANERVSRLEEVLDSPDKVEELIVDWSGDSTNPIHMINSELSKSRRFTLGESSEVKGSSAKKPAQVKIFKPHEIVDSEQHPGVQFVTSVIALDMFEHVINDSQKVGKLIFFKLDHAENDLTSTNLELGVNFQFGVFLEEGKVKPFKLEVKSDDKVVQELHRSDPTEESGKSVDAQLIQKNGEKIVFSMLDINEDADTYSAVIEELDKFISSRNSVEIDQ